MIHIGTPISAKLIFGLDMDVTHSGLHFYRAYILRNLGTYA